MTSGFTPQRPIDRATSRVHGAGSDALPHERCWLALVWPCTGCRVHCSESANTVSVCELSEWEGHEGKDRGKVYVS